MRVLSCQTISNATLVFLQNNREKLDWWLQRGHSCERWLQFEWAFYLEKVTGGEFSIECEVNRIDVGCFHRCVDQPYDWWRAPDAGIEIKFYGNWWIDPSFSDVLADIQKVDGYEFPSMAALFVLIVDPKPNQAGNHCRITRQIPSAGVGSLKEFKEKLGQAITETKWNVDTVHSIGETVNFRSMELAMFGYYNEATHNSVRTSASGGA